MRKVLNEVDWPCQVRTLFHTQNLGAKVGVSSAIAWMLESESEGIILDDDVVPLPSFYQFAD